MDPWMIRPGEGNLPSSARIARPGSPMVLDPNAGSYVYVVTEDGSIRYAPQYESTPGGVREVKHTDLAQNGPARVSGEIHYDASTGTWMMDTNSGRYSAVLNDQGLVPTRTRGNLDAAVQIARRSGTADNIQPNYQYVK
jgi:hypothetical protein